MNSLYVPDSQNLSDRSGTNETSSPLKPGSSPSLETDGKQDWKARKEEQAKLRKKQNDLKKTEEEIASLEERDGELDQELARPEVASDVGKLMEIHKEQESVRERLEKLYEVWESLAE